MFSITTPGFNKANQGAIWEIIGTSYALKLFDA
jgi:hypothetical protein